MCCRDFLLNPVEPSRHRQYWEALHRLALQEKAVPPSRYMCPQATRLPAELVAAQGCPQRWKPAECPSGSATSSVRLPVSRQGRVSHMTFPVSASVVDVEELCRNSISHWFQGAPMT